MQSGLVIYALPAASGVVVLWFGARWYWSNWRNEQIAALAIIDRLIERVLELSTDPASGLLVEQLGNLEQDWVRVRSELEERYKFDTWMRSGRVNFALRDSHARALSDLARNRIDPLHANLSEHVGGSLRKDIIAEVFEVLSIDLDALAQTEVRFLEIDLRASSPIVSRPNEKRRSNGNKFGPAQQRGAAQTSGESIAS